jgi:hypothetical protein
MQRTRAQLKNLPTVGFATTASGHGQNRGFPSPSIFLVMVALWGCGHSFHRPINFSPEPSASVGAIRVLTFDRQRAAFEIDIDIDSQGLDLAIEEAEYELLAQDRKIASGRVALRASATQKLKTVLPVQLVFLDLPHFVRNRLENNNGVDLVVRGILQARNGLLKSTLEFHGETKLTYKTLEAAP